MACSALSKREDQTYTSCYCEENVWKLCQRVDQEEQSNTADGSKEDKRPGCYYAVFISNESRTVPLWCQRASRGDPETDPVVWDYHVILASSKDTEGGGPLVFDLDSSIKDYPCSFKTYSDRHS